MTVNIGGKQIGLEQHPFIVAEMSGNHNQSLERALQIVDEAAKCGADAVKIQTYTADTITLNLKEREFFISDPASIWKGTSLYELYQQAHTPWEWHKPLFERCHKHGIICFSSPFDFTAVDFLEKLKCPAYKIASPEIVDIPLIRKAAKTGKPLIISCGMATADEIEEAVAAARESGCNEIILLKCTTSYPASPADSNLMTIPDMKKRFNVEVGLSDHTLGIGVALAAVALGASVIEKHFTLRRTDGGVDSVFSMDPWEMKLLVEESKKAWQSLGKISYGPVEVEKNSVKSRRSLYVSKDIKKGDVFTAENMRSIRPGLGLPPKYYDDIMGKKIAKDAEKGTPLNWDLVQK